MEGVVGIDGKCPELKRLALGDAPLAEVVELRWGIDVEHRNVGDFGCRQLAVTDGERNRVDAVLVVTRCPIKHARVRVEEGAAGH